MIDRKAFYDYARPNLFAGTLAPKQVEGIETILDAWEANDTLTDERWLAYMLATTHHETARTMQPIGEYGRGRGRPYGQRLKMSGRPYSDTPNLFYGRGYVQLTWYENYEKAGKKLGQDFIRNPALVMEPGNAAKIMFLGMTEGWFTGRKLADYFNKTSGYWIQARRIINGLDKAALIADYGQKYFAALSAGFSDVRTGFDTTAKRQ